MKQIIFVFLLVSMLLPAAAFAGEKAELDKPAPLFSLKDVNNNQHSLEDFAGKFVVLEWINFDCPFVKKHYDGKNMQKLQKEYTEKDVVWLSVCSSAEGKQGYFEKDEIKRRIEDHGAAMTAYLIDESGAVGKMYEAKTTPHMYVINPKGILIYAGGIDDKPSTNISDLENAVNYVKNVLDSAMEGKEVETKVSKPYGCSVKYK